MNSLTPYCIVEIDGRRYDSRKGANVISAEVNQTTDKTGEGVLDLYDPDFQIIDRIFADGIKSVNAFFWLGWVIEKQPLVDINLGLPIFTGLLARTEWSERVTTLRFHDRSLKMKQQTKTRYFRKKSDIQILKQLAADNGLKFEITSQIGESQPFDSLVQTGKTDWQFALKIAKESGLALYVKGDTLYAVTAGTIKPNGETPPPIILNAEKDFELLRGFGLSYKLPKNPKARPQKITVKGRKKDGKLLKGVVNTNTDDEGTTDLIVRQDLPRQTVSIAERKGKGVINKRREYAFEHHLKTLPSFQKRLALRDVVTLAGMGKFYSGEYIVTDIRYEFSAGILVCEMTVGSDKSGLKK